MCRRTKERSQIAGDNIYTRITEDSWGVPKIMELRYSLFISECRIVTPPTFVFIIVSHTLRYILQSFRPTGGGSRDNLNVNLGRVALHFKGVWF